jgi:aminocarboxymuconate-semialdehyde decarboxylase
MTLQIVDFHNHFVGPAFPLHTLAGVPATQRAFWESRNRLLSDPEALGGSLEESGIAARVVSTPLEFVREAGADVPPGMPGRINDSIAEFVARHPGRLHGLATVDAYGGEPAARELVRAATELGLRGVFVESSRDGLLPDCARAQPTFAAAASLGVPVFLHPVPDTPLRSRFKSCGRLGERLARGSVNSAALFAMLESGMFERHRNLRVVVTALALGGLLLAGCFGDGSGLGRDSAGRRGVYVDTTGMHPVMLRAAIELLGADRVVIGTDWPVVQESSLPARLQDMLTSFGLSAADQQRIAGNNALELLSPRAPAHARKDDK